MDGLWNKAQQTDAVAATQQQAVHLDRLRKGMVPGTWLTLSPSESTSFQVEEKMPSPKASALPSPALKAERSGSVDESLSLFLSNNASAPRSSSIDSTNSVSTKPFQYTAVSSVDERETLGLRRFLARE